MDLTEIEAQAAQHVGGLKQHGADLGQAVEAEKGFVEEEVAKELGADGAAAAGSSPSHWPRLRAASTAARFSVTTLQVVPTSQADTQGVS